MSRTTDKERKLLIRPIELRLATTDLDCDRQGFESSFLKGEDHNTQHTPGTPVYKTSKKEAKKALLPTNRPKDRNY